MVHEWLWELGIYEITRLGGFALAAIVSGLVMLVANVLVYRALRAVGVNELVAAVLTFVAGFLAIPSVGVRPREFTQLFLAYYVYRLILYRLGRVRSLWGLPIAMAFWVNLHGPFILGWWFSGSSSSARWWSTPAARRQDRVAAVLPRHLLLVGLATVAATAVNPRGPAMLFYPIGYYLATTTRRFRIVTEFQSPDFHDPMYLVFGATLLLFISIGRRQRDFVATLLVLLFAAEALISVRNVAVYAPVAIPFLGQRLSENFSWAAELKPLRFAASRATLNWILLAAIVLAGVGFARRPSLRAYS